MGNKSKKIEHKIKSRRVENLTNTSWKEKKKNGWGDIYRQERKVL